MYTVLCTLQTAHCTLHCKVYIASPRSFCPMLALFQWPKAGSGFIRSRHKAVRVGPRGDIWVARRWPESCSGLKVLVMVACKWPECYSGPRWQRWPVWWPRTPEFCKTTKPRKLDLTREIVITIVISNRWIESRFPSVIWQSFTQSSHIKAH